MNQGLTDEEIKQLDTVSLHWKDFDEVEIYAPSVIEFARTIETATLNKLNNMLDAVAKVASEAENLVISQREKIETLHRHIADIGEAMRTKANNNPDGVKSSTLEMLGEELLSVLPSNAKVT